MFMFAYERVLADNPAFGKKDIVMIGDTLRTDISGGNKCGLDTVLVLTGNIPAEDAEIRIRSTGIIPTYVCESAVIWGHNAIFASSRIWWRIKSTCGP